MQELHYNLYYKINLFELVCVTCKPDSVFQIMIYLVAWAIITSIRRSIGSTSIKVKIASCSREDYRGMYCYQYKEPIQKLDRFTRRHSVRHCCSNYLSPTHESLNLSKEHPVLCCPDFPLKACRCLQTKSHYPITHDYYTPCKQLNTAFAINSR